MFDIDTIVRSFFFLLGLAAIFGAMLWLISYIESKRPCPWPIYDWIRIFLAVAAVAMFIGFVMTLMGYPVIATRH